MSASPMRWSIAEDILRGYLGGLGLMSSLGRASSVGGDANASQGRPHQTFAATLAQSLE